MSILLRVLPETLEGPTAWDGSHRRAIASQDQGIVLAERCDPASAGVPPVGRGIDHGVSSGFGLVGLAKVLDPSDHGGFAESVAGWTGWVVFDIQHARESLAIIGPASTVGKEIGSLGGTGATVWVGEVVAATDQTGVGGSCVVTVELLVDVGGAFCRLSRSLT